MPTPRFLFRLLTVVGCLACASASAFDSVSGNFSLELPKNWKLGPPDIVYGNKEPVVIAPEAYDGLKPRLRFGEEKLDAGDDLAVYAKEVLKTLAKYDRFRLISNTDLRLPSGLEVKKVVYERYSNADKAMIRSVDYWTMVRGHNVLIIDVMASPSAPASVFEQAEAAVMTLRSK